ncbi:MAG: ABC transporter permease [Verrucomicrobia bacterium]|nr:ABC transporter permease [Verrucomicrobiota bacterium]
MIPTLLGVIMITFILFNVVGGSPAAMTLGKHVTPLALEEFDEVRGRNKPLFVGNWTSTRAYGNFDFATTIGSWKSVDGADSLSGEDSGGLILRKDALYPVPFAFPPRANAAYRWKIRYRLKEGPAELMWRDASTAESRSIALEPSSDWRTEYIRFETGEHPGNLEMKFELSGSDLEISRLELTRKTAHFFDSQLMFYLAQLCPLGIRDTEAGGRVLYWKGVDLGTSSNTNQRVSRMLKDGILPSLSLTIPIFAIGLVLSVSLSLVCAFFRNRLIDRLLVVGSVVLMSVNYIIWIVAMQYWLGFKLSWFPVWGYESPYYLALPILIGVVSGLGGSVRFYRTVMLDEMYKDYVRTAFAKGVSRPVVLFKHVLKNAMIPILTSCVIAIAFLYTGSLLLESFFGIPGLGYIGINAINSSDIDVIRAVVLIGALIYMAANLLTDIFYALVDPRVRLG